VIVAKGRKAGIEVWAQTSGVGLYRIPYPKPVEDAMENGREEAKTGQPVLMRKEVGEVQSTHGGTLIESRGDPHYESNIVLPSDLNPKT